MAQRLKSEVRDRILNAAADAFMQQGYATTRLSDVAAAAGVATGNLYRYFDNKEALFNEIVTTKLAADLLRHLRNRVRELRTFDHWEQATAGAAPRVDALLDFWIAHRVPVVILLAGAKDSPFSHVRSLVESELSRMATTYLRSQSKGIPAPAQTRFVLHQIFIGTVDMIVAILSQHQDEQQIRAAFTSFWRYQLAGLSALLSGVDH